MHRSGYAPTRPGSTVSVLTARVASRVGEAVQVNPGVFRSARRDRTQDFQTASVMIQLMTDIATIPMNVTRYRSIHGRMDRPT